MLAKAFLWDDYRMAWAAKITSFFALNDIAVSFVMFEQTF